MEVVGVPHLWELNEMIRVPGVVANLTEENGTTLTSTLTISSAGMVMNELVHDLKVYQETVPAQCFDIEVRYLNTIGRPDQEILAGLVTCHFWLAAKYYTQRCEIKDLDSITKSLAP